MRILFAGPSIYGAEVNLAGILLRAPAKQGDIARATLQGASAIGLVDGNFEAVASVWHKEILYAISQGVQVLGAASMGALRAAECAQFGMVAIGQIAKEYIEGTRDNDADVAISHGPFELGSPPITGALVDIQASVKKMQSVGLISPEVAQNILSRAQTLFFKERTLENITVGIENQTSIMAMYKTHFFSQKQADAMELIDVLGQLSARRNVNPTDFILETPHTWLNALADIKQDLQL